MGFETPNLKTPSKEQYDSRLSPERRQELIDAKNSLKEVVENILPDKLKTMQDGLTFEFIEGFDGDVNRYVRVILEDELKVNEPDVAAFHVTENLIRIKESLEAKQLKK